MIIPLPHDLAQTVAQRAVRYTRMFSERRNWSGETTQSFHPISWNGTVGIRTSRRHLLYQESGTRPYVMWSLEGKTIPMGNGEFRVARGVGRPGFVTLPGGARVWKSQKWRHPGLQPLHYMQDALERSIRELSPVMKMIVAQRIQNGGRSDFGEEVVATWGGP